MRNINPKFILAATIGVFIICLFFMLFTINKIYDQKENRTHFGRLLHNELFTPAPSTLSKVISADLMSEPVETKKPEVPVAAGTIATAKTDVQVIQKNKTIPILMYHHIRTFNDPADTIGTNLSVDPSAFASQLDYIKAQGYTAITFYDLSQGSLPDKPVILTFDDGYENFYENAYPELKSRGMKAVSFIITGSMSGDYMTEAQIKELSDNGFEIGAHSISHPDLSTATLDRSTREITISKSTLETIIGKKVISFCYPSGKYNDAVEKEVKDAGYIYATTTKGGIANFSGDNLALSRYRVNHDTNIESFFK
ncbi:MAG: polysaccharide deacetylase family protein [Candidatus Berkelbacteria bacterium]